MPIIDVDSLFFSYGTTPVLRGVSFSVEEGETIGLIGPNGGGKTTLLMLLMGFLKPTAGTIQLFGKKPKEARELLGWVPQSFTFDRAFPISVLDVVLMGRLSHARSFKGYHRDDTLKAMEALEKVGMKHTAHKAFAELSGGQAQRILIARALASEPRLLLLDEPTANVDLSAEREIYALLRTLKGELTVMMVTHDLNTAIKQVDRVFCVERELSIFAPDQVCEHFALGLYHTPLKKEET